MDIKFIHEQLAKDLGSILGKQIAIFGCGAIGANLTISLARRGFSNFLLIDYDKVQEHNISTQPWTLFDIGSLKVKVLSEHLHQITDNMNALPMTKKLDSAGQITPLLLKDTLVIDSFDNRVARQIAHELGKQYPVLHVGMSSKNTAEITWNAYYTIPEDTNLEDPCNYPLARTLIELSVVTTAESIIQFLLTKQRHSYLIKMNDLRITRV